MIDIVIGGTRGIGKAIVEKLNQAGKSCIITGRSKTYSGKLEQGNEYMQLELGDIESIESMEFIFHEYAIGNLYIVAGASEGGKITDFTVEDLQKSLTINLIGPALLAQYHITNCLSQKKHSSLVFIGSLTGFKGGKVGYSTSKSGLLGLTKSIAKEVGNKGIRANCIVPGAVDTDLIGDRSEEKKKQVGVGNNLGRIAQPEEIASIAVFLGSSESSFLNGSIIDATAGMI